jgi:hypothetical protein
VQHAPRQFGAVRNAAQKDRLGLHVSEVVR